MEKIKRIAQGYTIIFPRGNEPFQITTRLAEECGEVAKEVNHWEDSGIKRDKYGEPDKMKLASEIKNVMTCAYQLALYYGVEQELNESIQKSLSKMNG